MNFKKILIVSLILFLSIPSFAQKNIQLNSPDGSINFSFSLKNDLPVYNISFKGKMIIEPSNLSLSFLNSGIFEKNLKINKTVFREGVEDYTLVVGKAKEVHDKYKEVIIPLEEQSGSGRLINFVVRAFNDGVAFRYEIPKQKSWTSYTLTSENTTFNLSGDPKVLTAFEPNYTTPHEAIHSFLPLSKIKSDTLMDVPTLIQFPENISLAITEAALVDYAGMYLMKQNGVLISKLSPLPGQNEIKVKANLPHHTPWRVMLISVCL